MAGLILFCVYARARWYVLGVEALQDLMESRRCTVAAFTRSLKRPTQAEPFTVKQLQRLSGCVEGIRGNLEQGYGWPDTFVSCESEWSDAQHAEATLEDRDIDGVIYFLEAITAVQQTARAYHLRHLFADD